MRDIAMIFMPEHLELIKQGIKTVTRRPIRMEIGKNVLDRGIPGDRIYVRTSRPFIKKENALAWLSITSVTTEYVQEITGIMDEQEAEGITLERFEYCQSVKARDAYSILWQSMYKGTRYDWSENPLVWVIRFDYIGEHLSQGDENAEEEKKPGNSGPDAGGSPGNRKAAGDNPKAGTTAADG